MDQLITVQHNVQRGASVLEIMIAAAIGVMVISSAILVSFGNQSAMLSAQTNAEAVSKAQAMDEYMQALGRQDFNLVNSTTSTETAGGLTYTKSAVVTVLSDYVTKKITTSVSWAAEKGGSASTTFVSNAVNTDNTLTPNTCNSTLSGDWTQPQLSGPYDVGDSSTSGNPVTEIAVFMRRLFITTSNTVGHGHDFYTFDLSGGVTSPVMKASLDTNGVTAGLNSVSLASTSNRLYAYVANGHSPNWNTCNAGPSCSQVQVIDVTDIASPTVVKHYKIPATSTPLVKGSGGQGVPNVVMAKNGYLYVGLTKTASGPEFVILDIGAGGVASYTNPLYKGSYSVGSGVSGVYVRNNYAYLATADNSRELIVLNVTDASNPTLVSSYNALGAGTGNTVTGVGSKVFLGKNYSSGAPEFYVLDASNPASLSLLGTKDPGILPNAESINGIQVRDTLAFITMRDFFQIWNIANPAAVTQVASLDMHGIGAAGVASGCEDNVMYLGTYGLSDDKGIFYTITAGP